ncbi:MAG: ABC transporter permease, partial [Paracoccaceae bacterium]
MSELNTNTPEFAGVVDSDADVVADFGDPQTCMLGRIQSRLHKTPATVPLVVLVVSIAVFGVAVGSKFFS